MSRRDLGSLFDEEGQGATPAPSEAPLSRSIDEPLINVEARQMLEERSRAAREAAARAAEVAAQKGKELGKAALGALERMKEERQRRAEEKRKQEAFDQTMVASMSASLRVAAGADEDQCQAMLEGLTPEDARAVLADPSVREAIAPFVYDGMGQLPSELRPVVDVLVANQPVPAVGQGGIGKTTIHELAAPMRSCKRVALIGGGVLVLVALGGVAYWWSSRPAPATVVAPKIEAVPVAKPAEPVIAPAPVPVAPTPAPVAEPMVVPAPVEEPVVVAPVVEREPERIAASPELAPADPAPVPHPAPIKPRPKKVEAAQPSHAPKQEEQQIEQIHDFGKQLDELGKR